MATPEPESSPSSEETNKEPNHSSENGATADTEAKEDPDASKGEDVFTVYVQCLTGAKFQLQVAPQETVMEIRQIITESVEGCYATAFHLEVEDGVPLDDYAEIKDQPAVQPECTIKMRFTHYDDKGARLHVQRLMELIDAPLSDVYLATASFTVIQLPEGKKDRSYPSFVSLVPEYSKKRAKEKIGTGESAVNATFVDFEYALEVQGDILPFIQRPRIANQCSTARTLTDGKKDKGAKEKDTAKDKQKPNDAKGERDLEVLLDGPSPLSYMRSLVAASNFNSFLPRPFQSVSYSGWNPVPSHRRLLGELYYLEAVLLDGTLLFITCSTTGFFVNATTDHKVFRPERSSKCPQKFDTLLGLLYFFSPPFASRMDYIVQVRSLLHPFESSPMQVPNPKPWLLDTAETGDTHVYNEYRSQMAYVQACQSPDPRNPCREWNEEMQGCRELPATTTEEALIRDRTLFKVHSDFVEAAVKGCMAVVNRQLGPINPMDPELYQVFMNNNIFFSYAVDGRKIYKDLGGDKAAHTLAKQDLHGLQMVADLDVSDVCVIDTVVVDYKGRRVVAQSILPGILQGEQEHKHLYGTIDNTKDIRWNKEFHDAFLKIGEKLHFRPHKVMNEDGTVYEMAIPVDCKGIKGADNRMYMLELIRFTPRDPNFLDRPTACLRPELIEILIKRKKRRQALDDYVKARQASIQAEGKEGADGPAPEAANGGEKPPPKKDTPNHAEDAEVAATEESSDGNKDSLKARKLVDETGTLLFNPDIFTQYNLADDPETLQQDQHTIQLAADYVTKHIIPQMLSDFASLELTVIDTVSLTHTFHERGVNMRYLGMVADLCTRDTEFIKRLLVQEMIARACKCALRALIEDAYSKAEEEVPVVVAKYLNSVLGASEVRTDSPNDAEDSSAAKKKKKKKKKGGQEAEEDPVAAICQAVKEKFNFKLEADSAAWWAMFSKLSLLRAISLKIGLRLKSREYNFSEEKPIIAEDVAEFYPVVNHVPPKCKTPQVAMENGMMLLQMGNFEVAFSSLNTALGMYHQIMGPMNKEVATCFSYIGNIMYYAGDVQQALLHHHKALLISRRVLGYDNSLTSHIHQYMGLICHTLGRNDIALEHFRRAYYLMRLAAGFHHPEACISLANVGMMHQELGNHVAAVDCLKLALHHSENLLGANHPQFHQQFIACCYALSISLSQMGNFKEAVVYQKKVYDAQRTYSGATDASTADAEKWLTTLLKLAVEAQKKTIAYAPKPANATVLWPKGKRIP
eukprot:EG_transcript_628